ncbi:MAG: Mth938-like domain-containing protein [Pseudomonadota bacterium]
MKFSLDATPAHQISAYEPGRISIGDQAYSTSLVVTADRVSAWEVRHADELAPEHFRQLESLGPELVILGTGHRQVFPRPETYRALLEAGIGVEVMGTAAAVRTFNLLLSDGRRVVGAFIV